MFASSNFEYNATLFDNLNHYNLYCNIKKLPVTYSADNLPPNKINVDFEAMQDILKFNINFSKNIFITAKKNNDDKNTIDSWIKCTINKSNQTILTIKQNEIEEKHNLSSMYANDLANVYLPTPLLKNIPENYADSFSQLIKQHLFSTDANIDSYHIANALRKKGAIPLSPFIKINVKNKDDNVILSTTENGIKKKIDLTTALRRYWEDESKNCVKNLAHTIIKSFIQETDKKKAYSREIIENALNKHNKMSMNEADLERLNNSTILAVWNFPKQLEETYLHTSIVGLAKNNSTGKLFHWATDLGESLSVLMKYAIEVPKNNKRKAEEVFDAINS